MARPHPTPTRPTPQRASRARTHDITCLLHSHTVKYSNGQVDGSRMASLLEVAAEKGAMRHASCYFLALPGLLGRCESKILECTSQRGRLATDLCTQNYFHAMRGCVRYGSREAQSTSRQLKGLMPSLSCVPSPNRETIRAHPAQIQRPYKVLPQSLKTIRAPPPKSRHHTVKSRTCKAMCRPRPKTTREAVAC